jgi:N-acyl-D-amino-acid deacylase
MYDFVIRGATMFDGSGEAPQQVDVAVEGSFIAEIGDVTRTARRDIDAANLALAPGFIDVHTHDDFAVLLHPEMAFKVLGGVTTCVVGNCGMGAAPWQAASLMARAFHPDDEVPEYEGYAGYFAHLSENPATPNVAPLAGHGTIRLAVMGVDDREPTSAEMNSMKALFNEALDAGALGLSTGLIYEPGRYARTEEIIELATELSGRDGIYTTHMRDEGTGLVTSVEEALRIGREANVSVQISHHKAAGRPSWGLVNDSLELIEQAQLRGQTVFADQYPYTAGSTVLAAVLQNEMFGDREDAPSTPADVVIASCSPHPEWEGRSLADLSADFECSGTEAAERVLREAPTTTVITHMMDEDDVRTVMAHPSTMIGSDGIPTVGAKPHPRLSNTFARVLGHYARDEGVLSMAEAVRKMTGFAADTFGLDRRGYVREGNFADLVLFDAAKVEDRGTFEEPTLMPVGFHHVFVNGTEVVSGGEHTGSRPGLSLRSGD